MLIKSGERGGEIIKSPEKAEMCFSNAMDSETQQYVLQRNMKCDFSSRVAFSMDDGRVIFNSQGILDCATSNRIGELGNYVLPPPGVILNDRRGKIDNLFAVD